MAKRRVYLFLSLSLSIDALAVPRRLLIGNGVAWTSCGVMEILLPTKAGAARGAAELDFEYYVRDLFGGNKREGNVIPSRSPPMLPPRQVTDPLLHLLLNEKANVDCLSTLALVEVVLRSSPPGPPDSPKYLELDIERRVQSYRERAKKSFYNSERAWNAELVSDQYYFDLTSYALWRTAADLLPNYKDRDSFTRTLGRFVYKNALKNELLQSRPTKKASLVGTIDCVVEILDLYQSNSFCAAYRIGEEYKDAVDQRPVFDQLDDDALADGASVDCLVSILDPATLGASLQITGEQSRFAPDFVGATLAAMWETAGIRMTWETFFVDPHYRPNPKGTTFGVGETSEPTVVRHDRSHQQCFSPLVDYFPNEQLLQCTLTLA